MLEEKLRDHQIKVIEGNMDICNIVTIHPLVVETFHSDTVEKKTVNLFQSDSSSGPTDCQVHALEMLRLSIEGQCSTVQG